MARAETPALILCLTNLRHAAYDCKEYELPVVIQFGKISHFVRDDTSVICMSFRANARNLSQWCGAPGNQTAPLPNCLCSRRSKRSNRSSAEPASDSIRGSRTAIERLELLERVELIRARLAVFRTPGLPLAHAGPRGSSCSIRVNLTCEPPREPALDRKRTE